MENEHDSWLVGVETDDLKTEIKPAFEDERGQIIDVLYKIPSDHVGVVTFVTDAVRGNHFHRETTQTNYLISGRVEYHSCYVSGGFHRKCVMKAGDMTVSKPFEIHAFKALEPSVMLVMSRGPRGGKDYESDTYRPSKLV